MAARTGGVFDDLGWVPIAKLQQMAHEIQERLHNAGISPHEPVLIPVGGRTEDVASILAVIGAGAVAVPIHERAHPDTQAQYLCATGARFSLAPPHADRRSLPEITVIGPNEPPRRPLLGGAAMITFTSGSTGTPKGVVLSGERISAKLRSIRRMLDLQDAPESLVPLQLLFSFGQWATFLPLMLGGTVHFSARFSADWVHRKLAERQISHLAAVPSMLRMLANGPRINRPLSILTGGEAVGQVLKETLFAQWPKAEIFSIYGLTESGTCDLFRHEVVGTLRTDGLGYPPEDIKVRIAADTSELLIHSDYRMLGYLDQPALTAATVQGGWLRTGDLAEIAPDGEVRLLGRLKDLINRSGNKVSPLEVETIFVQHPDIGAVLATGVPDPQLGEAIHLLVVPANGRPIPDVNALLEWARPRTERFKLPDRVHLGQSLPTGTTGKADRNALRRNIIAGMLA